MHDKDRWPEVGFRCDGGDCVIVESTAAGIVIRDSKNPALPGLVFSRTEYAEFRCRVRGDSRLRTVLAAAAVLLRPARAR
jgi:Domain of unknown function (DUF397)